MGKPTYVFNMVVGCTGLITCVLLIACAFIADATVGEAIGMTDGPLLGIFMIVPYAVLANLFYTGGWIGELLVRGVGKLETGTVFALKAFRGGVVFSVFVTLLPAVLCGGAFAVALLSGQKHGPPGE